MENCQPKICLHCICSQPPSTAPGKQTPRKNGKLDAEAPDKLTTKGSDNRMRSTTTEEQPKANGSPMRAAKTGDGRLPGQDPGPGQTVPPVAHTSSALSAGNPERTPGSERATPRGLTVAGVVLAATLLLLKSLATVLTGSISILSDALNSFLDLFSYSAIHLAVRMQNVAPDVDHPFGHRRAEPLAGLIIAILAAVLGFNILREAITSLATDHAVVLAPAALVVMTIAVGSKVVMAILYRTASRRTGSPAMEASYVDTRNDILASSIAFVGFFLGGHWDSVAALLVGVWVIYSGTRVGLENIHYLMGRAPAAEVQEEIRSAALRVPGVKDVPFLRAHFVGDRVDAELHVTVDEDMPLREAHAISETVKREVERIPDLQYAFVHIEPVPSNSNERAREGAPVPQPGAGKSTRR